MSVSSPIAAPPTNNRAADRPARAPPTVDDRRARVRTGSRAGLARAALRRRNATTPAAPAASIFALILLRAPQKSAQDSSLTGNRAPRAALWISPVSPRGDPFPRRGAPDSDTVGT